MKSINFIMCLFIALLYYSCIDQDSNFAAKEGEEECVKERWLVLYRDNNSSLYQSKEGKTDPYEEIKQLILNGEVTLWTESRNNSEWLRSVHPSDLLDSIAYRGDSIYYNVYFDYLSEGTENLKTVNGEDSFYTYPDGSQAYLYPLPKYETLTFEKISEYRIKENLLYDSIAQKELMKPSLIGFDVFTGHHYILFWVKIDDLVSNLKVNKGWIEQISTRNYKGFTYKQYACKDPKYD